MFFTFALLACREPPTSGGPTRSSENDTDADADADADTDTDTDPTDSATGGTGDTAAPGLLGVSWRFDPAVLTLDKPAVLAPFLSLDQPFLAQVVAETPTTLTVRFALAADLAVPPVQDACAPTVDSAPADSSAAPSVHFDLGDAVFSFGGFPVTVHGCTATTAVDATGFRQAAATGEIDTRDLNPAIYGPYAPDRYTCDLLETFGFVCEPCSFSGEAYCLSFATSGGSGAPVNLALVERTEAEIDADPTCP